MPFRIGEDDALIPKGIVDQSDEYGPNFSSDKLICSGVSFPSDFDDSEMAGKTFYVGDLLDVNKIKSIVFENSFGEFDEGPDGYHKVTIYCENNEPHWFF